LTGISRAESAITRDGLRSPTDLDDPGAAETPRMTFEEGRR
jgi:hypothetical protein